jgi:hypothetical protein
MLLVPDKAEELPWGFQAQVLDRKYNIFNMKAVFFNTAFFIFYSSAV